MKFLSIILTALCFAVSAQAQCVDGKDPIALADEAGVATFPLPSGKTLRLSGLEPHREVCGIKLFETIEQQCPGLDAIVDAPRDRAKYCADLNGTECVHIRCKARVKRDKVASGRQRPPDPLHLYILTCVEIYIIIQKL